MKRLIGIAAALSGAAIFTWAMTAQSPSVKAADHTDPPSRTTGANADSAADIGDIYAWSGEGAGSGSADDTLVVAVTFAGPVAPGTDATYDRDVLYAIHIDSDGDPSDGDDHTIYFRFGLKADRTGYQVQVSGVPGVTGNLEGDVETEISSMGAKAWVGLRDDPFFMDLQGFMDTVSTGNLAFMPTRDFFEGLNITAFVIEIPQSGLTGTAHSIWTSTARITN